MARTTLTKPTRANAAPSSPALSRSAKAASPQAVLYDPDADVTASEPFDAMEFIRLIHEERDAS